MPEANTVSDLIYYASGRVVDQINEPDSELARRHRAVHVARALTDMMPSTPMILCQNAWFKGVLPQRPGIIARVGGSITGMAWEFKAMPHTNHSRGLIGRFGLALTLVDLEGYIQVDGQPYKADEPLEYWVDLSHSIGPFEEVA